MKEKIAKLLAEYNHKHDNPMGNIMFFDDQSGAYFSEYGMRWEEKSWSFNDLEALKARLKY